MVEDSESILRVLVEEDFCQDSVRLGIVSRHFDYRGGIVFNRLDGVPPHREMISLTMAAFRDLFRAYASMPFPTSITKPLLAATMERLLPELKQKLHEIARYYNRPRAMLVPDRPRVENFFIQGDAARDAMDRIETALRTRRPGDLLDLSNGRLVAPPPEPEFYLGDLIEGPVTVTGDTYTATAARMQREMEQVLMRGAVRFYSADWSAEVLGRARETLVHCLSEVQRAEFQRSEQFTVATANGKLFRVIKKDNFNVQEVNGDWDYCAVPSEQVCVYDKMLAAKLWLEAEYERFMRIANRRNRRTGATIPGHEGIDPWIAFGVRNPAQIATLNTTA